MQGQQQAEALVLACKKALAGKGHAQGISLAYACPLREGVTSACKGHQIFYFKSKKTHCFAFLAVCAA